MVKRKKSLACLISFVFSAFLLTGYASADNTNHLNTEKSLIISINNPQSVINTMIDCMNSNDVPGYISTFTKDNRVLMEKDFSDNQDVRYFREKDVRLVNIKKLPEKIAVSATALSNEEPNDTTTCEVYYVELSFNVDQEQKWFYNGTNHRVIVMSQEDNQWKIARVSVPSIGYLVDKGCGFGTIAEEKALNIEETMNTKGLVLNNEGMVIESIAAPQEELERERRGQILETEEDFSDVELQSPITRTDEHTRPDSVLVYFTKSQNRSDWGGVVRADVPLWDYCRDVLPNEWVASWYSTAPTAVRAGALVTKMYGWYHTYHPKRMYSPYYSDVLDNTYDQEYDCGSHQSGTDSAISDVGGIGIDSWDTHQLFETQYRAGTYDGDNYAHSGYVSQYGTKYWADQGKGYTFMIHYYYDDSFAPYYEDAHFFYY